jgi:glutaredoxin
MRLSLLLSVLLSFAVGCTPGGPHKALDAAVAPALAEVTAEKTGLIFVYQGEEGPQMAEALGEIPEGARGAVQVIDQSQSPAARGSAKFVQIFDLRDPGADGRYPGRFVPRAGLEAALAKANATPKQAPVIMYSASWCGVCRKASAFLNQNGIAFVEKDIEKDKKAGREYAEKLKRAGKASAGVPVFDVGGQIITGFDGPTLLRLARGG